MRCGIGSSPPRLVSSIDGYRFGGYFGLTGDVKQFRNHSGLTKIARCGFSWRKTTKKSGEASSRPGKFDQHKRDIPYTTLHKLSRP